MTTNLYAVAGPSKPSSISTTASVSVSPKSEPSPLITTSSLPPQPSSSGSSSGTAAPKPSLNVDSNGEVLKVPAFLNKLYTMVSDNTVDELIHWSEAGDSFFVPNSEQFGRELLPRWFKHSNFSSFVRQLNMYGFHKVPHLQAGALKNETPVELWEFANPFFKRDQPKLLAKVTRKNNRPGAAMPQSTPTPGTTSSSTTASAAPAPAIASTSGKYLITDGTVEGEAGPLIASAGQVLDLSAIHSGIAAIRQTQATIGADLRKLQTSNEALWRQAYETQEKQRKHEDTIDLIVSFLERLFGTEGEGLKGLKEAMRRGGVGGMSRAREETGVDDPGSAKKRRRVGLDRMIGDGTGADQNGSDDELVEIGSSSQYPAPQFGRSKSTPTSTWTSASQRFTTLPTEDDSSPSSRSASKAPVTPGTEQTLAPNHLSPLSDTDSLLPTAQNALAPYAQSTNINTNTNTNLNTNANSTTNQYTSNGIGIGQQQQPLMSPTSAAAAASAYNLDPSLLQTTIGSLLQSPAAAQMFLNSLNSSAQGQALQSPARSTFANNNNNNNINNINNNNLNNLNNGQSFPFTQPNTEMDPTLALFSPLPNANTDGLMDYSNDLLKSYQDAAALNGGVDNLQESIDSLVRSMGLDLPNVNGSNSINTVPNGGGYDFTQATGQGQPQATGQALGQGQGNNMGQLDDSEFDVDEFLQHLAKGE